MIKIFKTGQHGLMEQIRQPEKGCWISVVDPTREEQRWLEEDVGVVPEFVRASLDPEETSYIDQDEEREQVLVIADYPARDPEAVSDIPTFVTQPVGVVMMKGCIVTIAGEENEPVSELESGRTRVNTTQKTRLLLLLLLAISQRFLYCLRQIDRLSNQTEARLYKSMKNRELLHMLQLDKSLVYFSSSLKADELTINRIMRGKLIPHYTEDTDLLEDVLIEFRQAVEMCSNYSELNSRTMDGFSNVISNNMNDIMKELTVITLVMSIPNMVYGFYGMNVTGLPFPVMWCPLVLSIVLCIAVWLYFRHSRTFK
ncbi:magnesium transporter CorA family protein [uncultured Faecalibaculum sp.]|uniref:magnesium transporter CorA family protein n=2 Tax=uncultured Faecalibaculum sp. TaxID=1729681 RepID=UPI0026012441|nr:magnesium transporter CorA family protein [uncultured Faecalibaculum sp.]